MIPKAAILASVASVPVLAGAFVYNTGLARVEVLEKTPNGHHIRLYVPAVVVPIAVRLVPKEKLHEASRDLQAWLPAIKAASEELSRCPDGPLVEVDSRLEHVRIMKRGDALVIDVDDAGETVHVSLPIKIIGYTASQLASSDAGPTV
jgi:hypothetical protein